MLTEVVFGLLSSQGLDAKPTLARPEYTAVYMYLIYSIYSIYSIVYNI